MDIIAQMGEIDVPFQLDTGASVTRGRTILFICYCPFVLPRVTEAPVSNWNGTSISPIWAMISIQ